jgi:molybdopterin-guanine dinucleotide biosynthesis protein A
MKPVTVILAGGQGSRIGGEKPSRLLRGQSLLDRAVARARTWSDTVAIAARSADQVHSADCEILVDPPGLEGPLGGLASALGLGGPTVLTIACDMPFLPDDLPGRLVAAIGGHGAALAASNGRVHPVCGLWRTDTIFELQRYASSGRRSLIGFAQSIGYAKVVWEEDFFFNVNTPLDLLEADRRLG